MHIKAPGILSSSFPSASLPLWLRSALHQLLLCCVRPGLCCLHVKMSITTTPTHPQILTVSYRGQCTLDMSADTYCQHALKTVIHSSTAKSSSQVKNLHNPAALPEERLIHLCCCWMLCNWRCCFWTGVHLLSCSDWCSPAAIVPGKRLDCASEGCCALTHERACWCLEQGARFKGSLGTCIQAGSLQTQCLSTLSILPYTRSSQRLVNCCDIRLKL